MNRMVGSLLVIVIPGRAKREPQMRNRASGNLAPQSPDSGSAPDGASRNDRESLFLPGLRTQPFFLLAQFGRQRFAEIFGRKDLPDFDLVALAERRALHPADRFIQRFGLDQPEPGDQIAGQFERPAAQRVLPG